MMNCEFYIYFLLNDKRGNLIVWTLFYLQKIEMKYLYLINIKKLDIGECL